MLLHKLAIPLLEWHTVAVVLLSITPIVDTRETANSPLAQLPLQSAAHPNGRTAQQQQS